MISELVRAIRQELPGFAPGVIFDVGANVGSTATTLAESFPTATVYAFEPVAGTFRILLERTSGYANIRALNAALGRRPGRATMRLKKLSVTNRIAGWRDYGKPAERVSMTSGDVFCAEHGVSEIGILKIDTEGHDLEVLRGFRSLLRARAVDLVEAEVGMNPENRTHVSFQKVKSYVERLGYRLFLIYEQAREPAAELKPAIRRVNAVFVSPRMIGIKRGG